MRVSADAPLTGLTMLAISSFVAAPLGGMTLAQLGALEAPLVPAGAVDHVEQGWPSGLPPEVRVVVRVDVCR